MPCSLRGRGHRGSPPCALIVAGTIAVLLAACASSRHSSPSAGKPAGAPASPTTTQQPPSPQERPERAAFPGKLPGCTIYVSASGSAGARGRTRHGPTTVGRVRTLVRPGSTVCLLAGTYRLPTLYLATGGKPGRPITWRSAPGARARIVYAGREPGDVVQVQRSWVTVGGLLLDGGPGRLGSSGVHVVAGANHVRLLRNTVVDTGGGGLVTTGGTDYITIAGNVIWHCGYNPRESWSSGISLNHQTYADRAPGFHSVVVGNVVAGMTDVSFHHTDGNGIILDLGGSGAPPALVAQNVVYENGGRCIHVFGVSHAWVVNNTCWANALDPTLRPPRDEIDASGTQSAPASDVHFVNNVVRSSGTPGVGVYGFYVSPSASAVFERNAQYGGRALPLPNGQRIDRIQLPQFRGPLPEVSAGSTKPEALAPPPWRLGDALALSARSPLLDAGIDPVTAQGVTPAIADGIRRYLGVDIAGHPRPRAGRWDLGAYERPAP